MRRGTLFHDDSASTVIEYALIAGIASIGLIFGAGSIGVWIDAGMRAVAAVLAIV